MNEPNPFDSGNSLKPPTHEEIGRKYFDQMLKQQEADEIDLRNQAIARQSCLSNHPDYEKVAAGYRMVSDGKKYRVEQKRRFLLWQWWEPIISSYDPPLKETTSKWKAKMAILSAIEEHLKGDRPWNIIDDERW